jgi:hypothetical protein
MVAISGQPRQIPTDPPPTVELEHVPMILIHHWSVIRRLDPRVRPLRNRMDCRVKPGNDA